VPLLICTRGRELSARRQEDSAEDKKGKGKSATARRTPKNVTYVRKIIPRWRGGEVGRGSAVEEGGKNKVSWRSTTERPNEVPCGLF